MDHKLLLPTAFVWITVLMLLLYMLTCVPAVGGLITIIMGFLVLGALLLTNFGIRLFISERIPETIC